LSGLGPTGPKNRGKSMSFFEQILTENGDINREQPIGGGGQIAQSQQQTALLGGIGGLSAAAATGSTRRDLKQGQFDIRALQHKQQMAEITRQKQMNE
jgi:hypothetical protein